MHDFRNGSSTLALSQMKVWMRLLGKASHNSKSIAEMVYNFFFALPALPRQSRSTANKTSAILGRAGCSLSVYRD